MKIYTAIFYDVDDYGDQIYIADYLKSFATRNSALQYIYEIEANAHYRGEVIETELQG